MKNQRFVAGILVTALVLPLGSTARADVTHWDGVGGTTTTIGPDTYGNWTSPANWDNGIGISTNLDVVIGEVAANGGRVLMNANADSYTDNELWFGTGPNPKNLSLTITGGILQHTDGAITHKTSRVGDNGTGVITQTGGTLYMNKGELRLGNNNTLGGNGLYDISGGTLSTTGGLYPGGNVVLNRNKIQSESTGSSGELRISGTATVDLGYADTGGPSLRFGPGTSTLSVAGPDATINMDSISMSNVGTAASVATIRFSFDQTGVSTINLTLGAELTRGVLDVVYSDGPLASGTFFDLMTGGTITNDGLFVLNSTAVANGWSLAIIDAANDILRLTPAKPGDANLDTFVDGGDYTLWADHFLQTGQVFTTGDFTYDGIVDGGDYTVWADNYAPAPALATAVPEPSTLALFAIGALALFAHTVRRRLEGLAGVRVGANR